MKNYLVKVIKEFNDYEGKEIIEENKFIERKKDDEFYCTKNRFEYLKEHGVVELIGIKKAKK